MAVAYTYPANPLANANDILATDVSGANMKDTYTLFGSKYNGKICMDIGYNLEDILMTWKAALSYRDCYKNLLYTVTDFSNWLGPKAMWVDNCEFHSDEDMLIYSYNPFERVKDTGDISMLLHTSRIRNRLTPTTVYRRPAVGHSNFYRDCLVVDDDLLQNYAARLNLAYIYDLIKMYFTLFNVSIEEVLFPKFDYSKVDNELHDQQAFQFSSSV